MADHLSADASAAQRYLHSDLRELFRQAQIAARATLLLPLPRAPGSRRPLCGDAGKRAVRSRQRQTRTPQGQSPAGCLAGQGRAHSRILETLAPLRMAPRTLALELKAELIRQLCGELLANHERVTRLERMLRDQLLPATQQTITTTPGIGTIMPPPFSAKPPSSRGSARPRRLSSITAPLQLAPAPAAPGTARLQSPPQARPLARRACSSPARSTREGLF